MWGCPYPFTKEGGEEMEWNNGTWIGKQMNVCIPVDCFEYKVSFVASVGTSVLVAGWPLSENKQIWKSKIERRGSLLLNIDWQPIWFFKIEL